MRTIGLLIGLTLGFTAAARADEPTKADGKTYQVPYKLTDTKHILVRAKINGKGPYNFIVDTGAPALFVSRTVCKKLGIEAEKGGWAVFDRFEIEGGAVIPKAKGRAEDPFQLEGMNGLGLAGAELHGIIGYTILARYRLTFDFTSDKMTWTALDFEPPDPVGLGEGAKLPEGMDMLAGMMKMVGQLMGRKPAPDLKLRGFFGMEVADENGAVTVKALLPAGPAAKAGVKVGDKILECENRTVRLTADLLRYASRLTKGKDIELSVQRGGEEQSITVKVGEGL